MTIHLHADATPGFPALDLRPWETDDIPALIEIYRDPVLRRWTRFPVNDENDAKEWLETQRRGWADRERCGFAVLEAGRPVAHILLKKLVPGEPSAEVGYWTAAEARGRGIAVRALDAVSRWAFTTLNLERLDLLHQVDNLASCRVAQKCGYTLEAVLPPHPPFPNPGHLHTRPASRELHVTAQR
ncbi:GNAT family N-acetyltransferase [Sphaerisporangium corydalis]|uniref:GNAT family N-acetyltransferase n=1 Tax=Sphaerisporangium corydalis TaxID=1441875 RepID=A0ABV9EPJ0_9ACTN|nr:GNAT family N-acetyltransferase [Sphaerisporangium corydalis]